MKKTSCLIMFLILIVGCAPVANTPKEKDVPIIVTSFYPIYIFTKNIVGESNGVTITMLTPPSDGCIHDFALGPRDMETLAKAGALVINGGGMESFLDKVVSEMPDLAIIDSSQNIKTSGDNPHFWLSPALAAAQAKNIADALCELDIQNAEVYRSNYDVFEARLLEQSEQIRLTLEPLKDYKIMVFHESFEHFTEEFELNMITCTYDETVGLSPAQIEQVIQEVKSSGITALCYSDEKDLEIAELVSRETGAALYKLNTITDGPNDANAYFTLMKENVATLQQIAAE